jgi:phosphatidylinositol 3-kinase
LIISIEPVYGRTLRRGKHRLLLWPGIEADGNVDSSTPSKMEVQDEMGRLEKARRALSLLSPHLPSYSWSKSMSGETYPSPIGWTK